MNWVTEIWGPLTEREDALMRVSEMNGPDFVAVARELIHRDRLGI